MTRRVAVWSLSLALALIATAVPANAHLVANYPTAAGWKYSPSLRDRNVYQAPNDSPNAYNGRAGDAID